jgi:TRAP-type C4-dicarboxylate transport system substrate-binding protein
MTFHNYGPTVNVMNLEVWNGLADGHKKLMLDVSREAQAKIRELTESVDNFEKAKELLGAKGMIVVQGNVEAFRKVAQEKIWPAYKTQYAALWDEIDAVKA